ncbi:MAG: acetyl-CoA C-acyltransferase [Paracoccaceae bacterium]|jgi:acetyl-CoA C-acetyltransferase
MTNEVVIAGYARTPMGGFQGELSAKTAPELGGIAIAAALKSAGVDEVDVDELIMGNVLSAGVGQAPARQAGFLGGLPKEVPASTLNKMCGSGMKTVMIASDMVRAGSADVVVAGGMESMTNAPYLSIKTRGGARMGHIEMKDHMFLDGLEDAYEPGRLMGTYADDCAQNFQFTREAQDEYALASLSRALRAEEDGSFKGEIATVEVKTRKATVAIRKDEQPANARPEKIPTLRPAFHKDGTVTAANASSISDGAAAMVITSAEQAEKLGMKARARIMGYESYAAEPENFPTAPIPPTRKLLAKLGWDIDDVDLFEVNEAFAVVPMAFMRELGVSHDKVNVNGGACALGHPIGASGARILVTLLSALEKRGLRRGVAAICIGGGEGTAIAIERL